MNETLHTKYRPEELDGIIGQDAVRHNLGAMFGGGRLPKAYLFTGPSGTGKTTIARIVARMVGVEENGLMEVDAARYSGVEQMRGLVEQIRYVGLGNKGLRFLILDECHAITKAAWQPLLKSMEEPAAHLYIALCTTEPDKIPNTIKTRCHAYDLKPVKWDLLAEYLEYVASQEKLKVKEEFIAMAARQANGSVRQALVNLSVLDGITAKEEAARLLEAAEEAAGGAVELARILCSGKGATWENCRKLLEDLADTSPEAIRLTILHYANNSLLKTESEKQAQRLLAIIQAFSGPCNPSEKMAPVCLAVGSLLFS